MQCEPGNTYYSEGGLVGAVGCPIRAAFSRQTVRCPPLQSLYTIPLKARYPGGGNLAFDMCAHHAEKMAPRPVIPCAEENLAHPGNPAQTPLV